MIRLIAKILVLLFLIALLLAIFAPSLLSTQFGKTALFRTIKSMTGYEIHSEELKLQWMQGQEVLHIDILDKTGRSVFRADSVTSTAPLWKLLFYHDVGHLEVKSPFVIIDPPQQLASKLVMQQAGFFFSVSITPSKTILGEISVTQGSAQFITPGLEPISIKDVTLEATFLPNQIKIQSSGTTEEKTFEGSFDINLLAYPGTDQIDANLKVTKFPLRAADQIVSILYPDLKGVIRDTIGESFNAELKLKNLQDSLEIFLNANSDHFSANLETKVQDGALQLASPAVFQFQIPADSFEKLTSVSIKNTASAQLKIDELTVPLQNRQQFSVQGTIKSGPLELDQFTLDPFALYVGSSAQQGEWSVKIESPQIQFQGSVTLADKMENLSFNGQALLPKNTKLDITASSLKSIALSIQGDVWKGRLKGAFDPHKKTASLTEPGFLSLQLENLPYSLPTIPVQITLQPCIVYLQTLNGIVKGVAEAPAFQMAKAQVGATSVPFIADLKSKSVQLTLTSSVDDSPLLAEGTFTYPQTLKIKGSCSKFPVASLQPFITNGPPVLPLLGDLLTTHFAIECTSNSTFLQLNTTSPLLTLKASLKGSEKSFELLEPANFTWTLTPEGYTALTAWLHGSGGFNLSDPTIFKGAISSLSFSPDNLAASLIYQGKITSDRLSFERNLQNNRVSQIQINLSHPTSLAPHQFQISATADPHGTLSCQGNWTPQGTAAIKLALDKFPSATFDLFAAPFQTTPLSFAVLCGPTLNLSLNTTLNEWSGPLQFELYSVNVRTSVNGAFTQGTLTLTDPFHLQLDITKELSQMFLKRIDPNDDNSIRSKGPVTLEINPKGFSCPLFPLDLSMLQISAGRLELGKLLSRNEGNLQTTVSVLKLGKFRSGDELELWFAPLDFKIQNGITNCERTEILVADEFQVCTWGTVDIPGNSIDGILGLTTSCLNRAFGIKGLPENYVLQIPVRGTLTDAKIDKGKATTKIGALMLWQQKDAIGGMVKGPAGKILGGTLNQLGPIPGGDQKAPPAKKPFPWDETSSSKKKTSEASLDHKKENKKLIRPEESALKQVLKFIR